MVMKYLGIDDKKTGAKKKDSKRALGIRDRQILWERANKRCENPTCNKKIDFTEMQAGHKTPYSKGGKTTLDNAFCLCYKCNKLQGTDSWAVFLKKQGYEDPKAQAAKKKQQNIKQSLNTFTVQQLKFLADSHNIQVKGKIVKGYFDSHTEPPTKQQYISKLCKVVKIKELSVIPKETPKPVEKKQSSGIESIAKYFNI